MLDLVFRKVGSWGSQICSDKINWLRWLFDHYIKVFDGRCGSFELPVTFFFGSIWKDTGDTQGLPNVQDFEGCCILHWNFLRDLVDSGSCRLFVV